MYSYYDTLLDSMGYSLYCDMRLQSLSSQLQTCQPSRDLTSDPGIQGSRDLLKLVSAGLSCEFANYEVNNYQCCYKQTSYSS